LQFKITENLTLLVYLFVLHSLQKIRAIATKNISSRQTRREIISSLVENDEEQASVSSMVSSLSSFQQNMTGGGVEEDSSKEVDEEDLNRLLLNIPLTTKERKITIHQLEEENRILKLKISLLKMEKSVLSTIRKTNSSSPDEKLKKASGIPLSLQGKCNVSDPKYSQHSVCCHCIVEGVSHNCFNNEFYYHNS
jgi:hypothetical protein